MNIVFIGSVGRLSYIPLRSLIESKHNICALVIDNNSTSDFNITTSGSIQSLALNNSIPVIKLKEIASYKPDIILVSCYARRLSQSILSLAQKGSFNIHPSLLPEFRGPVPLFWQFRQGVHDFGVSIHRMTKDFDSGNIVSHQAVTMQDAINIKDATECLANVASDLILKLLDDVEHLSEVSQNKEIASYQSYPTESDYSVSTSWPAKRIYNFINAYKGNGVPFLCKIEEKAYKLIDAYSYQEEPYNNMNGEEFMLEGEEITFACLDSYIRCKIRL